MTPPISPTPPLTALSRYKEIKSMSSLSNFYVDFSLSNVRRTLNDLFLLLQEDP